jgi:hypothetical protein
MNRLYVPSSGLSDWHRRLANPARQWKATKSAYEAAVAWEGARERKRGLPGAGGRQVAGALRSLERPEQKRGISGLPLRG